MKFLWAILGTLVLSGIIIMVIVLSNKPPKSIAGYSVGDPNAPRIEVTEKTFDFGKIKSTDVAKHDFKIKNTGKNPLVITDIMTSCHCTTALLKISGQSDSPEFSMEMSDWQGEIAPGAEATLEAIYKPAVMPVSGQVSRVVTFKTNDPANKEVQLELLANVQ